MTERFVVFSKPDCKWCDRAKEELRHRDRKFDVFDLTLPEDAEPDPIKRVTPYMDVALAFRFRTVPAIFVTKNGTAISFLGGYEALKKYLDLQDSRA